MHDDEIARHLQEALNSGELKLAESFGKPLQEDAGWEATPDGLRMPFKVLKNAGMAPPEVELFHRRAALQTALQDCSDEAERQTLMRELSDLQQSIALRLDALRSSGRI
ncbi:DnaJ family domain-containing protein [Paucibacter sp. AS339]|uniref:DnaJ family domain-containing protein n=1 Tax=Paucibacter hankyongi TaxID=3133434 RepID=UPI003098E3B3